MNFIQFGGLLILLIILLMIFAPGSAIFANLQSSPLTIAGTLTTVDGTLVELEIDMTVLRMPTNGGKQYILPKLKRIDYEIAGGANILDTPGDEFTVTITPVTHSASHVTIDDRYCMFKDKIYQQLATAATNTAIGKMSLIQTGYIRRGVVVTSSIFLQVTLDGAAQAFYFTIEFEWIKVDFWEVAAQYMSQGLVL